MNGIELTEGSAVANITIKNLLIANCENGIITNGFGNNTFYDDYFLNCSRSKGGFGILLQGCSFNKVSYCTFDNELIISMDYQADYNFVTENNLPAK